jgi:transglutaminase-like putative cysteine protease
MATTDRAAGARNTDVAQTVALIGLLTGASLSVGRLYEGNAWWLPTWLTMLSALGLAALLRRAGAGQLLSLAGMAAGFVVVAGILLFPTTLWVVIPTPGTIQAMVEATQVAMRGVVDQAAPVDVTREFLLITCAGAWAVATSADGLTFRARQPLLAVVPALGLFVFPAIVRNSSPAWYALWFLLGTAGVLLTEGRARLATWGRWVSSTRARPASGWRLPATPAASTGRWLAAAAGVIALTAPWLLPGYGGAPLLDYRTGVASDAPVTINPFVSLRTRLRAVQESKMFTVEAAAAEYWRLLTLDHFDGTNFRASGRLDDLVPFQRGPSTLDVVAGARTTKLTQRYVIDQLAGSGSGAYLPAAVAPVTVETDRRVWQNLANRGIATKSRFRRGFSYTVESAVPQPQPEDLLRSQDYTEEPGEGYLQIDGLDERVRNQAVDVTRSAPSAYQKALYLQRYLRSSQFAYDLDVESLASGRDQLTRFLFSVRRGYCEQFAIAMAAMARSIGLPARVAIGFTPGRNIGDAFEVTTRDAHAWPEIWFSGVGWVRFEPTPRPDQVDVPGYSTRNPAAPVATTPVTTTGANPSGTTGPTQSTRAGQLERPDPIDPALGLGGAGRPLWRRPEVVFPAAAVLLVLAVPLVKAARNLVARRRAARRPRDAIAEAYREVTAWADDAGIGRAPAETPDAYAARLAASYDSAAAPMDELTRLYVAAEYARDGAGEESAHRARRLGRSVRAGLAARLGWRRRLAAALSPRSLLTPHPLMQAARGARNGGNGGNGQAAAKEKVLVGRR